MSLPKIYTCYILNGCIGFKKSLINLTHHIINIGILAHIDAGKTSLSERLLYNHKAIKKLGSVDDGSTQTDGNALERERGITIRSAVAAFALGDLQVNLVDTPGHPDFIAEVDRALAVLDGAILVISAVEGVQAQTITLMKSLKANKIPTLIFLNKIDRMGARSSALIAEIAQRLNIALIPQNKAIIEGNEQATIADVTINNPDYQSKLVETIAEHDLDVLQQLMDGKKLKQTQIRNAFKKAVKANDICPLFVGSALADIGIEQLSDGIKELLPQHISGASSGAVNGHVFAINRLADGTRQAYIKLDGGKINLRDEVEWSQIDKNGQVERLAAKVTGLDVIGANLFRSAKSPPLTSGAIGCLRGLTGIRVGARFGQAQHELKTQNFLPPTLESIVTPLVKGDEQKLYASLISLSDEDPLIHVELRADGLASVLLYGEVQKEVIADRLSREFGVEAAFSKTSPLFVERPLSTGAAEQVLDPIRGNDFWASIGFIVEPNPFGTGNSYVREVIWGQMVPSFYRAVEDSVHATLKQGLNGWPVRDCKVRLVKLGQVSPISTVADFKGLVPIILLKALQAAQTQIYEPCQAFELEIPNDTLGDILGFLSTNEAQVENTQQIGAANWLITGETPSRCVQKIAQGLPFLSHGEALFTTSTGKDRPYKTSSPQRLRTDGNPLNYIEYMSYLSKR